MWVEALIVRESLLFTSLTRSGGKAFAPIDACETINTRISHVGDDRV